MQTSGIPENGFTTHTIPGNTTPAKEAKKRRSHEERVARFYSHGSKKRSREAEGFLSFGFWNEETADYHDSSKKLLSYVLENSRITNPEKILNVACGYGTETIEIFKKLQPHSIHAIDITEAHIRVAKQCACDNDLDDKITFQKMDACRTAFEGGIFSHIVGIEGPAHFNTRAAFFMECRRLLKTGGVLLLTDILINHQNFKHSRLKRAIGVLCSKSWHMPLKNWMNEGEYRKQLEDNGFAVEFIHTIGDMVYPGFAKYNTRRHAIRNAIATRGIFIGIGITFISWLLGQVHRRNMVDYIFVKAVKGTSAD